MRLLAILLSMLLAASCTHKSSWNPYDLPDDEEVTPDVNPDYHGRTLAPMCWSVYEYAYEAEQAEMPIDIPENEWERICDWLVKDGYVEAGYDMIITDGFMAMWNDPDVCPEGYMTHYGSTPLKTLVAIAKERGLKVGVYDNPLWKHCDDNMKVEGTNVTWGSLRYNDALDRSTVLYPGAAEAFHWIVPSHKGAKECIDGFFKWYSSIGINYIRMDFLCLFERANGGGDMTGKGYGRENYRLALQYISESAKKYGVFTSLVMPNNDNDAEIEAEYGDMMRIVADTFHGGWDHVSDRSRGWKNNDGWATFQNEFDGYTYWSHICSNKGAIIPDGDFIRLNTLDSDNEREFEISLHVIAGGPLEMADQYSTIGEYGRFYKNSELIALVKERFQGHPLGNPWEHNYDENNQIWAGQTKDGGYVIAFFNREGYQVKRNVKFTDIGAEDGLWNVRDLWRHANEGQASEYEVWLDPHSCKVIKISK